MSMHFGKRELIEKVEYTFCFQSTCPATLHCEFLNTNPFNFTFTRDTRAVQLTSILVNILIKTWNNFEHFTHINALMIQLTLALKEMHYVI